MWNARQKTQFFSKSFQKNAEKLLFYLFFQTFACSVKILVNIRSARVLEALILNLINLKKGWLNFQKKITRGTHRSQSDERVSSDVFFSKNLENFSEKLVKNANQNLQS